MSGGRRCHQFRWAACLALLLVALIHRHCHEVAAYASVGHTHLEYSAVPYVYGEELASVDTIRNYHVEDHAATWGRPKPQRAAQHPTTPVRRMDQSRGAKVVLIGEPGPYSVCV